MLEVKPNLLDRLIAYVSPRTAARRMHARYCMAAAGGLVAGVRRIAGGHDGTLANWNPRRDQRLSESLGFDKAMLRAESLACNDGHAASCVDALALNVAGPGLRPQSYPDAATLGITEEQAADFAESAETAWSLWCAEADAAETLHFDDLQYQAVRSMFVTGEFLHLTHWNETPGRTFGLSLQALHPARLRTPSDLQCRTDIRSGVHLGERGQPKGYFIANPPENMALSGLSSAYFQYVPRKTGHRWSCLHRFHSGMPEEARGTSVLSPAMKQFRDLADYVDYELVGALIAASFTVFIETPADALRGQGGFNGRTGSADYPLQRDRRAGRAQAAYHLQRPPGANLRCLLRTGAARCRGQYRTALRNGGQGLFKDQLQQRPGGPAGSVETAHAVSGLAHPRLPQLPVAHGSRRGMGARPLGRPFRGARAVGFSAHHPGMAVLHLDAPAPGPDRSDQGTGSRSPRAGQHDRHPHGHLPWPGHRLRDARQNPAARGTAAAASGAEIGNARAVPRRRQRRRPAGERR